MRFNKNFIYAFLGAGIVVGIISTMLLLRNSTQTNSNADTTNVPNSDTGFNFPTPSGTMSVNSVSQPSITNSQTQGAGASCPAPDAVQNVKVEYPGCDGDQCSFTKASCSWDAVDSATNYSLTITEVDSGQQVLNQTEPVGTTNILFDVTQEKTYKCSVSAVSSCGTMGVAGTDQLLCHVDGLLPSGSPSPSAAPPVTAPPATVTSPPPVVSSAPPTVVTATPPPPVSGPRDTLIAATGVGALFIVFGGLLFLL